MPASNLSPLAVVPYGEDYLIEVIRHRTGWDQRSEVCDKPQLIYLCNYLKEKEHINAQTIVVENDYIDRNYLEDYSAYYARCFPSHLRKSSRIHFFSDEFDQSEFISALERDDTSFFKRISKKYIGYIVIRPVPHTFISKLCLKPYPVLTARNGCKLIAKEERVSLFGITLKVKTVAFMEQDKVVSACATSSLWMFFNSSEQDFNGHAPSPSTITKSATGLSHGGTRTFPTTGLSSEQISRSLQHFGFEPSIIELPRDPQRLKEIVYSYVSNNIPVLIAGDVFQTLENSDTNCLGRHLICALGYQVEQNNFYRNDEMQLVSQHIDRIYVHEDRHGPYLKVDMKQNVFDCEGRRFGHKMSTHKSKKTDYFVPHLAIVGTYHKIRLPYDVIKEKCESFHYYLKTAKAAYSAGLEQVEQSSENLEHFRKLSSNLGDFLNSIFDITLTTNTALKEELRKSNTFGTFNGSKSKSSFLLHNMPKYIWRCRIFGYKEGQSEKSIISDILFDATEIAQGQILFGYISYTTISEAIWEYVEHAICQNSWDKFSVDNDIKQGISAFFKFFSQSKNKAYLNSLYGPLGLPRRSLKPGETDYRNNITLRSTERVRAGDIDFISKLDNEKPYIWVINEYGDLIYGEDVFIGTEFQGHPTLVDGGPARLGGELKFSKEQNCWEVNLSSGTYSSHLALGSNERLEYLKSVLDVNLRGGNVKIDSRENLAQKPVA